MRLMYYYVTAKIDLVWFFNCAIYFWLLQWVNGLFAVALRICACGSFGTKITQLTDLMSHSTNETFFARTPHLLYHK